MITAQAPGKIILFGEHAVVYGRPAIAIPVMQVQARVTLEENTAGLVIRSSDQHRSQSYVDLDPAHPLATIIRLTLSALGEARAPNATLTISSTIPVASGLGSGAAVSTAIARALAGWFGRELPTEMVSDLVYQVEKIHHGTPSGIDNTVIAYAQPVYFVRDQTLQTFAVPEPFKITIADTGIASPTKIAVSDVRKGWEANPARFESLFEQCGAIAEQARLLIGNGQPEQLGPLMFENHTLLQQMNVSCPELDALVESARNAGALGAKLSGGGRGGNMIALVTDEAQARVKDALQKAGAKRVITTIVGDQRFAPGMVDN